MIIEAICENGMVQMPQGLRYRHKAFKVKVELPDQEVMVEQNESEVTETGSGLSAHDNSGIRARIDAILGSDKERLTVGNSVTPQECKDLWHEHLEDKYLDRSKTSDS